MMSRLVAWKWMVGVLAGTVVLAGRLEAAAERPEEAVEIPAEEEMRIEKEREVRPMEEIREEKEMVIPEVPKPVKETGLSTAEKAKLDGLEHERAAGKLTETEYELEKDSLLREANINL